MSVGFYVVDDQYDSFVVNDDEVSYMSDRPAKKGKKPTKLQPKTVKGKRRIVKMSDSSSEEEERVTEVFDIKEKPVFRTDRKKSASDHETRMLIKSTTNDGSLSKKGNISQRQPKKTRIEDSPVSTGLTQVPSLAERVQNRLQRNKDGGNQSRCGHFKQPIVGTVNRLSHKQNADITQHRHLPQTRSRINRGENRKQSNSPLVVKVSQSSQSPLVTGMTQIPSLETRCRNNLAMKAKSTSPALTNSQVQAQDAMFSLGVAYLMDDADDDILEPKSSTVNRNVCDNSCTSTIAMENTSSYLAPKHMHVPRTSHNNRGNVTETSPKGSISMSHLSFVTGTGRTKQHSESSTVELGKNAEDLKAERLRLSKLKQEEFRRKLAQKQQQSLVDRTLNITSTMNQIDGSFTPSATGNCYISFNIIDLKEILLSD